MTEHLRDIGASVVLDRVEFDTLLEALQKSHHRLWGPTIQEGNFVYAQIASSSDLPIGFTDRLAAGSYRLVESGRPTLFGYTVGQHSWKQFLYPPEERLWQANRSGKSFEVVADRAAPAQQAFIGVRACELAALKIHDSVLLQGSYNDPNYLLRRENTFVLAVNCTQPGGTCFCASLNTGPTVTGNFDLALTEVCTDHEHYFVIEIGSAQGAEILSDLPFQPATELQLEVAAQLMNAAHNRMGRELDVTGLKELLYNQFDSLHWEDVARRCLSCANCTMVCPTCFCTTTLDFTDLTGDPAERRRRWDSCYAVDFSYIHGGSIRNSGAARYRQWLTHKLGYWQDQFGSLGCVGCGRCITWCPAAIDITEEVSALRAATTDLQTA